MAAPAPRPGDPAPADLARLDTCFGERSVATPDGPQCYREAAAAAHAPVIVLLHGIGSGAASWLDVALDLSRDHRVIAWDAPGYGGSAPLATTAPGAADYADRLDRLLAALDVEHCVLAGHSLGALTACAHAARTGPAAVRRLVLLSPARGYGGPEAAGRREIVRTERLGALAQQGLAGMADTRAARMLSATPSAAALAWVRWNMARLNDTGYRQAVALLCDGDVGRHAPLPMPVEVHVGDEDTITPPAACASVAQLFGASCTPIAGSGHACHIEQPAAVAAILRAAATEYIHA